VSTAHQDIPPNAVKDKKMSFIRYFERAQPGKKRKIENEKTEKSKEYRWSGTFRKDCINTNILDVSKSTFSFII
jgi:hypothetical protein